jgi:hypothetical protein
MVEELLRGSLVEDSDGKLHLLGHPDLHGAVMSGILRSILFGYVGYGRLAAPGAPFTLLRLESFWD